MRPNHNNIHEIRDKKENLNVTDEQFVSAYFQQ